MTYYSGSIFETFYSNLWWAISKSDKNKEKAVFSIEFCRNVIFELGFNAKHEVSWYFISSSVPDFISNLGAFPNSAVYPKLEPPLLQDLQVNKSSKAWVLDEDKLREIHSNSLIVHQKRRERSTILNEVNRLDDVSSKIQAKLQRLEYLTQKVATMNTERTRLMCENENFRLTIQEKTKHSIETGEFLWLFRSNPNFGHFLKKSGKMKTISWLHCRVDEKQMTMPPNLTTHGTSNEALILHQMINNQLRNSFVLKIYICRQRFA